MHIEDSSKPERGRRAWVAPKITRLSFTPEEVGRIRRADDPAAELAAVYRQYMAAVVQQ